MKRDYLADPAAEWEVDWEAEYDRRHPAEWDEHAQDVADDAIWGEP